MAPDTRASVSGISPFLDPGPAARADSLAIVQLSRDSLLPVYLRETKGEHDGYAEGAVVNTRYGSFPHSTMIGVPWGSQVRASKVDTGSRGRKRKRAREDDAGREDRERQKEEDRQKQQQQQAEIDATEAEVSRTDAGAGAKQAVAASSGFVHLLPPTPELWTASLPHRTQVVYTPDYSYILHRIRARPGTRLIEAGSGSGSFTHAAVRAVYNGYPTGDIGDGRRKGAVFSFEFHRERYEKMKEELAGHGLGSLVRLNHRNVYEEGFLVEKASPEADAVFLDLPAPWEALPHLSRRQPPPPPPTMTGEMGEAWVSPLNPKKSVHICTFSPCIEQVTRTVSTMRRLGWVDIEMVEIANRKLQVFHERIGLNIPQDKGANMSPANVDEAVARLADIEERFREYSKLQASGAAGHPTTPIGTEEEGRDSIGGTYPLDVGMTDDASAPSSRTFAEGRLITRGDPEIKTHTSYLVFAVLPREWTEEDEAAALEKWPCGGEQRVIGSLDKATRRKEKRERLKGKAKTDEGTENKDTAGEA